MSMNPRKGTVTDLCRRGRGLRVGSDEHESSEGDCDLVIEQMTLSPGLTSDEHESSEGDCDH